MPGLHRQGDVFVLSLGADENRFNPDWVGAVHAALDEVSAAPAPRALVLAAEGKFFSNGLDLEWMGGHPDQINGLLIEVHRLLARVLGEGVPSVAAIQGHCFAAGAMLALAADFRVMRADRGFFCLPEVDIRIPFTPGMNALIAARLPQPARHEAMTTGRRYGGEDAARAGIVDHAVGESEVLERAVEVAGALAAKDPGTLAAIKERLYADALATLRDEAANTLAVPDG